MLKSFVAGMGIFLAGLFGTHQVQPAAPVHTYPPAAHVAIQEAPGTAHPTVPAATPPTSQPTTIINRPVIEHIVERAMPAVFGGVTKSELDARLQDLTGKFSTQLAKIAAVNVGVPKNFVTVPVFAQAGRIDNLANVSISNATVSGVTGLTNADIPDDITASNYLPLSGGSLTFASSTLFSVFNGAYFGATATSSFDSTGALTLATPLLVSSGGTGANTLGQGWLFSNGGSAALAASTSPTVNYITATSTTATSMFAGGLRMYGVPYFGPSLPNSPLSQTTVRSSSIEPFSSAPSVSNIEWRHDSPNGYILHLVQGSNMGSSAALIGLGVDEGGRGLFVNNKKTGQGIVVTQNDTITSGSAYGLLINAGNGAAPGFYLQQNSTGANSPTGAVFYAFSALNSSQKLVEFRYPGDNLAGYVQSTDGNLIWNTKVGIGSTSPSAILSVTNTSADTTLIIEDQFGDGTPFTIDSDGSVGVGTTTPVAKVEITKGTSYGHAKLSGSQISELVFGHSNAFSTLREWDIVTNVLGGDFQIKQADSRTGAAKDGTTRLAIDSSGKLGIATTTPWRTLSVTGTVGIDGLTGSTGAGSLCLSANKEVVYNSGSDSCLSSTRATKRDITALNLSALEMVAALQPVSFIYNNDASSTVRYGFIAEDTAAVDSHLGTYDQAGNVSGVDDRSMLAIVVKALQSLIDTVGDFANSLTTKELTFTRATGDDLTLTHQLCIQKSDGTPVCVTGDQLAAALGGTSAGSSGGSSDPSDSGDTPTRAPDTTPPTITINGDNPAHINVGDTYADLGASVTDNIDQNLGLKYFLNGTLVSNIIIDTSAAATDTIDYVATDQAGNTATSTRTAIIEVATSTSQ
ncbi:MAG: DUF5011 domain-containing protein [Pseudolabrys sp.]|nr:DUF5011 domain-containing protein [Pseudolabrys sp.]MDP2294818.1 DUF5011 domain-containing protein [Pseudolabrys sp.]